MTASIEAGAGTGKTTRVVGLLLDRLLRAGTEPSRLLALTFTVRAANEMRDRLGSWLARLVDGERIRELGGGPELFDEPDRSRERGARALAELDRIEIGTIHSFAAHLLRQYPVEAGVNPGFVEDEGGARGALFRELWPRWLDGRLRADGEVEFVTGFLGRFDVGGLREFAMALCEGDIDEPAAVDAGAAAAWRAELAGIAARARRLLGAHHPAPGKPNEAAAVAALEYILEVAAAGESGDGLASLRRRGRLLHVPWPGSRAWKDDASEFRELAQLARSVLDCDDAAMARLVAWLRPFVDTFRREYARRGFVSFGGLLTRAAGLLRLDSDVRAHLKGRFRLILVDEFQDTDPLQSEILLYLAERQDRCEGDWRRIEVEPGKLIIVGDEKQSIYLFRGADLEAYQQIAGRLTGGRAEAIERLSVNYRSRHELVHFVNAIGRHTMIRPRYARIEPSPSCTTGGRIEVIVFPGMDADAARECEARAIAGWVADAIREGALRAGDVAILLRTLAGAQYYTAALRDAGIDFVIEGEKQFYEAQEVVDFLNLLAAIADPMDELAVVGLLRSPIGAVRDRELVELRRLGALSPFDLDRVPDALPHVRDLYGRLVSFHERSRRLPVRDMVAAVLDAFPVRELARAGDRGEQALANVVKLGGTLVAGGGGTLATALLECRRRVEDGEEEGEAALADEELDAVRILSIHKAKGLEFPAVVLADLHREPPPPTPRPVLREWLTGRVGLRCGALCNRQWIAADARYRAIEREEALRVLYVALTRARDRLLLTGGSPERGMLAAVLAALGREGLEVDLRPEQTAVQVVRGEGFTVRLQLRDGSTAGVQPPAGTGAGTEADFERMQREWLAREREYRRHLEEPPLQQPSIAAAASAGAEDEGGDDAPPDVPGGEEIALGGTSLGSRCHEALAEIDLARPELTAEDDVRELLEPFLRSDVFREIRSAERVEREVPFVITLDDVTWSGQLDVLYRIAGRWIVADYKSDRVEQPQRYRTQAAVYARAAQRVLGLPALPEFRLIYLRTGRVVRVA